ncbi:MAG: YjgP/YjgQ family permease [candidate division Zixibacteria bacterium]|nr:YjgP/YjgQ family permease [candidate division Zixibacteria bacterium]
MRRHIFNGMEASEQRQTGSPGLGWRILRLVDFRNTLARYILREHIGPFAFAFIIIIFILIIDFVPNLVDMVVGKDLPASVILKVFFYQIGWMIALAVPMAVLVATLMAFGRLTGDLEVTAVKSSGIHVMRMIYPVLLVSAVMAVGMVYFSNDVLPDMNHRARVLMQDVRRMRPTLKIRSGAFMTDIPGYILLIDSVDYTTSQLRGVKILELGQKQKAPRTIVSQTGVLTFANNGRDLIFDLADGEIHEFDENNPENYRRLAFHTQKIVVTDVSSDFEESGDSFRNDREKSAQEMMADIRQWREGMRPYRDRITNLTTARIGRIFGDSLPVSPDRALTDAAALNNLNRDEDANLRIIAREAEGIGTQQKLIGEFMVEVHKKYSIPVACVIFALVGAPLGIVAKRGGMGLSIGISLGLFVLYWAFLIGGEDLADRGIITPFWAMWSANILLTATGLYLIYIVSTEKPLWTLLRLTTVKVSRRT